MSRPSAPDDWTVTGHAAAVLRESAKQHRLAGDDGFARACDRAAILLRTGRGSLGESSAEGALLGSIRRSRPVA